MSQFLFTSESVSEGHPDKVADQISDAVLDAFLAQDPRARVAAETLVTTGMVMMSGEITSHATVDFASIARKTIEEIGYTDSAMGFDYKSAAVLTSIGKQSPDIAMGVDRSQDSEQGAGDQGIMFGYAINETPELMPLTLMSSHTLLKKLAEERKSGRLPFLRPDSKSQVTVEYVDGKPKRIDAVVLSTQHSEEVGLSQVQEAVMEEVIKKVMPSGMVDAKTRYYINPTGRFVVGGPQGDCGLTGRKIIVDTYGGHGAHGGGAFSGKDPSKVDRSAAYAARHVAKNIVAAGLADRCLVQLAYAIGVAEPVSVFLETYGTEKAPIEKINAAVQRLWKLTPYAIVEQFDLLKPRYRPTAAYGHFGRNEPEFTWERTDKVEALRSEVGS